ncbi:MAG: malto-oligosyltrehalose trehalohydrolase [Flaviaesturariibacter sp.]|nr:malto-oligosyltrehalose trehalohydrolase [Flaviaesturariibacter sp.]
MDYTISKRQLGVNFKPTGEAEILLWAPTANKVELVIEVNQRKVELIKNEFGYWSGSSTELKPGDRYGFSLDGKNVLPDPASLAQPDGVHGLSQAVDLKVLQREQWEWSNIPLQDYILYELHTGTFSAEGNFEGIEKRLDHLAELGVTAIELMPVAQFPGNRNWGYDGVFPFAVQHSYGGASGLKYLVDACHRRGLAVVLDVVYNHLGPEGNYLGSYGPYFTDKYKTPWGGAINFDDAGCDGVRLYFIENVLMWFRDFGVDALRMDAVHAIKDFSPVHILQDIRQAVDALMAQTGKTHYLIVELDLNDTRFINTRQEGGYGMDAQWIDEFHHALRVTATGENTGYYSDFSGIRHLAKAYQDAYVYDGQYSPHRQKKFGIKAANSGQQFIVFSQNHDQVGNRMLGERTSSMVSFEMQKLLTAAVIISPFLPMLFMGEEWSEPAPFLYFVSHTDPDLAEAVRRGRKEEFAAFHSQGEAPDPMSEASFRQSKLQWELLEKEPHKVMLQYYRSLIALRKGQPALRVPERSDVNVFFNEERKTLVLERQHAGQIIICLLNFSREVQEMPLPDEGITWNRLFDSADAIWLGKSSAPQEAGSGMAISVQPESLILYSNSYV